MRYCRARGLTLDKALGHGIDGIVYSTSRDSAVKVHERHHNYYMECDVYERLAEWKVRSIRGHAVPQMIGRDDGLWVLEMSIVRPPYVLDFAKASIDFPPEFPDEVMEEWRMRKAEEFGDRWPQVLAIMDELESRYGIFLLDLNSRNITFE